MSERSYHEEALRRTRVLERKKEALKRLSDGPCEMPEDRKANVKNTILFTGPGDYDTNRSSRLARPPPNLQTEEGVVFEEVVHDPNFNYRIQKESGNTPLHVDPIYRIMYPGTVASK